MLRKTPSWITDDMEIAPDFFEYFEAAAALLDNDKYAFWVNSSLCVLMFFLFKLKIKTLQALI